MTASADIATIGASEFFCGRCKKRVDVTAPTVREVERRVMDHINACGRKP